MNVEYEIRMLKYELEKLRAQISAIQVEIRNMKQKRLEVFTT